jgi:hypothetical protein
MSYSTEQHSAEGGARVARPRPFGGLIDAVIVPSPTSFDFDGAIAAKHAEAAWVWMQRDLAPDLIPATLPADDEAARAVIDAQVPVLLQRAKAAIAEAANKPEALRRIKVQFGGEPAWLRLPVVLQALKCRAVLEKAQGFGRAANAMTDEAALGLALQSMPLSDAAVTALLMHVAVGQVSNPSRLMTAALRIAGSANEGAVHRAGFSPLVDAMLSHAQAQLPALDQIGAFADIDLVCRSVDRFHRLMRAVSGYLELGRFSRWAMIIAGLTKTMSELIEPKLANVAPDVNRALRRRGDGLPDRIDSDQLLQALNGCYILSTVRDCRDSLALNALFEQTWTQVGQMIELHMQRNLDAFRANPADHIAAERLDGTIKMAELRFNAEYADVIRKARDSAERRAG